MWNSKKKRELDEGSETSSGWNVNSACWQIPREGGLPYETDGDARRKIRIKPLKETNLGVAQALFEP